MKFLFLPLILIIFLASCSLNKNSSFWNEDQIEKSSENKKLYKLFKKNNNYKDMTFDEFNLFLKDYSENSKYPEIK